MIFRHKLIERLKDGSKTQHRLPVNGHTTEREYGICKVKPQRSYPVQTVERSTEGDGYGNERQVRAVTEHGLLIVTTVVRQPVEAITVEEAKAEGFARKGFGDREGFFAYWQDLHGSLGGDVWVVEFEADMHAPRYLRRGSGYTLNIAQAIDDPLPVVPAEDQARFTKDAHRNAGQQAAVNRIRRERYDRLQRLERVIADAELQGVDISSPLRVIERQLARAEKRVYEGEAA